jgi:uncharacterized protein (DUF1697 family)
MPKYVAFLRAINVGGHVVKMDQLRRLFEAIGFSNVETFIASGNVIFDSKTKNSRALEQKIENHLRESLAYEVRTFVRTPLEVAEVTRYRCFTKAELEREGNILHVGFLATTPSDEAKRKLLSQANNVNDFHVHDREVYWLRRTSAGDSEYSGQVIEKTLGVPATFRNSTTVKKIAAKYAG